MSAGAQPEFAGDGVLLGLRLGEVVEGLAYARRHGWQPPPETLAADTLPVGPTLIEVLDFEWSWPGHTVRKAQAVRSLFGISPAHYFQRLERAIADEAVAAARPDRVAKLREDRGQRRARRIGEAL